MRFAQLEMFSLLWLVGVVLFIQFWSDRRRDAVLGRFASKELVERITASYDQKRAAIKRTIYLGAILFCIVALARPQWGFQWQEVKRQAIDILVVIDVSKSMLTSDVKPNRLERTKLAVKDLLKKLKGDRIGLIGFAGDAFMLCPLTVDYEGFLLSLNDLNVNSIPRGGTNIGAAIKEAIKTYDDTPNSYKSIVIITDGDNLEGDPLVEAKKAKEMGIKIYTAGIGTPDGELIQVTNDNGEVNYLKDEQGNFVKSRLNERLLQEIALMTEGVYIKASGAQFGLDVIYDKELSKIEKREVESKMEKKYFERFQIPLAVALLLLVLETCLTTRRKEVI